VAAKGVRDIRLLIRMGWYAPLMLAPRGSSRDASEADVERWVNILKPAVSRRFSRLALIAERPEFRSLLLYRIRRAGALNAGIAAVLAVIYPGERTLHLSCSEIGPGLFIQHGFATIVAASRVGANCWINQQVTIGFINPEDRPVIGDGVFVHAGAKVLGAVHLGDGCVVGANAVVLKDVPAGFTAVGVPARLLPPKANR